MGPDGAPKFSLIFFVETYAVPLVFFLCGPSDTTKDGMPEEVSQRWRRGGGLV